jgi:hypothetical protein
MHSCNTLLSEPPCHAQLAACLAETIKLEPDQFVDFASESDVLLIAILIYQSAKRIRIVTWREHGL